MNKVHEKYIRFKYPKIFSKVSIDCGDGWFDILYELAGELELVGKAAKIRVEASQVKEKFGTLRFYHSYIPVKKNPTHVVDKRWFDIVDSLIADAEHKSESTCERCGDYGIIRDAGWVRCLCDKCEAEKGKK